METSTNAILTYGYDLGSADNDRWAYRYGSRFASPQDWLDGLPRRWTDESPSMRAYVKAMAAFADGSGVLTGLNGRVLYERSMSEVLRTDADDWSLSYDRFTAMVLAELDAALCDAGYLAYPGKGDSDDRRLTLPAPAVTRG